MVMKKHSLPFAALVISAGLLLVGCDEQEKTQIPQRCVDDQGRVVDDHYCEADALRPGYGTPNFVYVYHWYWGGPTSYVPTGTVVRGGTYRAPAPETVEVFSPSVSGARPTAVAVSPSTAAVRGLIGSSAAAHGEGGFGGVGE
jgi:hypothetical protein